VFDALGKPARGKSCEAIEGIIAEGEEIMEEFQGTPALDAGLISTAQSVEHYEIARYGTLKRWAMELGQPEAAALLDATLQEEMATDTDLGRLADSSANQRAKDHKAMA
jgi:ferritin-like metal-binding protein YciE